MTPGSKDLGAIWFIGDSITQSNADGDPNGSPRKSLYDLLMANGYTFSYTGHFMKNVDGLPATGTNAAENLYQYHSGVSGSVIGNNIDKRVGMTANLSSFWTSGRLATVKPNIILIMLGANDVGLDNDLPNAPQRLQALVQAIYDLPGVGSPTIFLANITPDRRNANDATSVITFNAAMPSIVAGFQAQGKDIHFVDQFTAVNENYAVAMTPGNLHPNAHGNDLMAQQWFDAITSVVKNGKGAEATPAISFPGTKSVFKGFDRYDFSSGKGDMSVICPRQATPGKPWLWRGMFWGGNSSAVRQVTDADLQLVAQGYYVVKAPGNALGYPAGSANMDAAYNLLTKTYGFSQKPSMGAMSRETLSVIRWASAHPDEVSSIYLDHGVCSLKSWPGGKLVPGSDSKAEGSAGQWAAMKKLYGFDSDTAALAYDQNPIDLLGPLANAGVPLLLVCGEADITVPYEGNGAIMRERYEKLGGSIHVILQPGVGHHPHGLKDPTPILDFIKQNTRP